MKSIPFARLLCFLPLIGTVNAQTADDYPRREAIECRERGGVPNGLAKLRRGDGGEIRVAYLGGSITAAPGWRVKSLEWLQQRFPRQKLTEINAAIGGTGSDLGVFRHGQDVLRHRPDLLFVEFAVNDGGAPPERIHQAMEGIVRQTWAADPATDIVFVYTISEPFLSDLKAGKFSRAASAMEAIADHYGIPSIHFGIEVADREKAGTLVFKGEKPADGAGGPMVFSTDGVHPLVETGHEIYREVLARSWEKLEAAAGAADRPHALQEPFRPDHWQAAKLVPITRAMISGSWEKLDSSESGDPLARRFARQMPEMWKATAPGARLAFRFRGTVAGVYDLVGPDGGQLNVVLDDQPVRIAPRFDAYCTYHRLSKLDIGSGLDPDVEHRATLTLDAASPDKAKILFERNRPDLEKNPDKYAGLYWHAGAIMLIGDLVE
ncbi:MAG: SGNH/GDSL hydrolase family protein [Verrucomicrobiales bacterium]|nr:SGNH/GDSL hydrolase family protein [Verrucomicrobiales bacterium]